MEPVNEIGAIQENKLYAFKYVTWVRTDKKCVNRLQTCDPDPVKPDGTLNNVYNLYAEWIDDGQLPTGAKDKYHYNGTDRKLGWALYNCQNRWCIFRRCGRNLYLEVLYHRQKQHH